VTLAIGPEGGWSAAEKQAAGERLVSLGSRTLRADTAALAALAAALVQNEEL
jgi:RsmE family RNA methyltransferase